MNPVEQVKPELIAAVGKVVNACEEEDWNVVTFFADVSARFEAATDEEALLEAFILLSTTAFQGFQLGHEAIAEIDRLLEMSEQIATTFSVSRSHPM